MIPFEFSVCMSGEGVLVEVDATVGELAEGSLLLDLGSLNGVLFEDVVSLCQFRDVRSGR
jgi:hypothetical protein